MHPEIKRLLDIAKKDGQISETDRKIILQKAKNLGLPKTEINKLSSDLLGVLIDLNKQKKEVFETTCPNCGATVMSNDITCSHCNFTIIDKQKEEDIDSFIIETEEDMTELIKMSSLGIFDTSIITSIFLTVIFMMLSVYLGKIENKTYYLLFLFVGFQAFLITRRPYAIKFISKYTVLKDKFIKKLDNFIQTHTNNKQILKIKEDFAEKVKINYQNTIKKFITSGSIGIIIFIIVFKIAYPGALYTSDKFKEKTLNYEILNTSVDDVNNICVKIKSDNFTITTREEYFSYRIYFQISNLDIELNPNIFSFKDSLNSIFFELTILNDNNEIIAKPFVFSTSFNDVLNFSKNTDGKITYTIQPEFSISELLSDKKEILVEYYDLIRKLKKSKDVNVKLEIKLYE